MQVYLYDSAEEQLQFCHAIHPNLDLEILQLLTTVLRDINPLVQYWRTARERILRSLSASLIGHHRNVDYLTQKQTAHLAPSYARFLTALTLASRPAPTLS